jgi:Fe-S cluster biogenesis protein NfuA
MADLAKDVANAIDEMRPYLERSGATLDLLGVEDGIAHVVASTAARGHLVSNLSFVAGIERALMDKVPGLRGLAAVNLPPYTVLGWDKPSLTGGIGLARERVLD